MQDTNLLERIADQAAVMVRCREHYAATGEFTAQRDYLASIRMLKALLDRRDGKPEGEMMVGRYPLSPFGRTEAINDEEYLLDRRAGKPEAGYPCASDQYDHTHHYPHGDGTGEVE